MKSWLLPVLVGVAIGAVIAPKLHAWIPALPSLGR